MALRHAVVLMDTSLPFEVIEHCNSIYTVCIVGTCHIRSLHEIVGADRYSKKVPVG